MRDHHRRQLDFLRDAGAIRVRLVHAGTRHPRITFTIGKAERSVPVASSPGDWRSTRQAISALRRLLREA